MKKRHHYLPTALAMVSVALCLFGCPIAPKAEPALSTDAELAAFVAVWEGVGPLFAFDPATASYSVGVPNSLISITVVLLTEHPAATMALNGVTINSGDSRAIPLDVGSNVIALTIVAEDGVTKKTYSLEVNRAASDPSNADLAWMIVSEGGVDPDFTAQTVSYDVAVDASVSNMTIMPFVSDLAATVKVDGIDVAHAAESAPITLGIGSTTVSVLVTAGDGSTTKTYTITVIRPGLSINANLSDLVPIPGSLSPAFSPSVISYSVSLSNSQESIRFTPTAEESHATITVDGEQVDSGNPSEPILLDVGSNEVNVVVTAQDGSTTKTYTITVTRAAPSSNANLSDLVPIPGSLSPDFSPSTLGYAVSVDSSAESIRFSLTAEETHASITVNGQQIVSGGTSEPILLDVGSNEVNVVVTAEDGTTTTTYTITVTRAAPSSNANLSNLVPIPGPLTPDFESSILSYAVSLGHSVESIRFSPTAEETHASITVNGEEVASGNTSGPILLNVGPNVVNVVVTAEDGATTRTYTITVTRANAAGVTVRFLSSTALRVSWAAIDGAEGYNVHRGLSETGAFAKLNTSPVAGTSFDDTELTAGTEYWYKVAAVIAGVEQAPSAAVKGVTMQVWARTYGGTGNDAASCVRQTADGGYIVAGGTESFGAGDRDVWVLRLDSSGAVIWQKAYGGASTDAAVDIQQTADGGYVVVGITYSFGAGGSDIWVLKLDASGAVSWQKTFGGSAHDRAASVQQTVDGGFIVAGESQSFGAGIGDMWLLKLTSSGGLSWQKTYGRSGWDGANAICEAAGGGYLVAGFTSPTVGGMDAWLLRLGAEGSISWQKKFGWTLDDWFACVQNTEDGGFVTIGVAESFSGNGDWWVVKVDAGGAVSWQKTYGSEYHESVDSIQQVADGGYAIAGYTWYGAGGLWGDAWAMKLDASGDVDWQRTFGGYSDDAASAIQDTSDGGYIVAGRAESFGAGGGDVWVLKLSSSGELPGADFAQETSVTPTTITAAASTATGYALTPTAAGVTPAATVTNTSATVMSQYP